MEPRKQNLLYYTLFATLPLLLISAGTMFSATEQFNKKAVGEISEIAASEKDKTLSPYFFVSSGSSETCQLPLKSTSAEVNIAGVIADVAVYQEYVNDGKTPIEAIYVFPASTRAAVYSMKMTIGDRIIEARIAEREKARHDYEQARAEGKSASLLEQDRPNVFQMNVANIMPGDRIRIEMHYTELLIPDEGIYEFVYPTVVGPRYSNQVAATAPPREKWVNNPYTHEGEDPLYSFALKCTLAAGMPVSEVICPSHKANIQFDGPADAVISLPEEEKNGGNRDFILRYRLAGDKIQSGVLLYPGKDESFFLAMIQPPKQVLLSDIPPREYVFIVDVSGSMHGFPLEVSKKLLRDLIGKLRSADRFNVLLFSGGSNLFSETSVEASEINIEKAINFINRQNAGGGTELLPALNRALSLKGTEGFSRSFIIATDGYVTVEKEAFDLIRKNMHRANFFAFGIGSSVNRLLIEGMAHAGMGMPFVVTKPEESTAVAEKFRRYIQNPVLTHIATEYVGFDAYDIEPLSVPDVFSERPVIIFGKYRGKADGKIILRGKSGEKTYSISLPLATAKSSESNSAIKYLWARERIRTLSDYASTGYGDEEEYKKPVVELGLKYNLLTAYTSFVAIDSQIRNGSGNSTTMTQPLPLPEGVSDQAVGGVVALGYGIMSECNSTSATGNASEFATLAPPPVFEPEAKNPEKMKSSVYTIVEQMPEFIGGDAALQKFLSMKLKYPEVAKQNQISGKVYVQFVVDEKGNLSQIKVLRGIGGGCDEEAIRVVKLMNGLWKAGQQNGRLVKTIYTLPIVFTLT